MIPHAKLFGDNGQIVLPRNQQIYMLDSARKIYFQVYHLLAASRGDLNWLDGWMDLDHPQETFPSIYK